MGSFNCNLVRALGMLALCAMPHTALADDTVKLGVNGVFSDVVFYIAEARGFFKEEHIKVEFVSFDSGPKMIAPLGTGELDAAAGASSAGLFNAVARGIDLKVVADKGSMSPGHQYMPLLVRKDLFDSGRIKTYSDLKGLSIGEAGEGGSPGSTLNQALIKGGLTYSDVQHAHLGYPQQVLALGNHAIDAAITTEPSATMAVRSGVAVRLSDDSLYPDQQVAVLLYGGDFIRRRHDVAERFMVAYLQAARVYNDAIAPGRLTGPGSDEIVKLLLQNTALDDPELIRMVVPNGNDPNGHVNDASLATDLAFFKQEKYVTAPVTVAQVLDKSFAEAAVKKLGTYQPKK